MLSLKEKHGLKFWNTSLFQNFGNIIIDFLVIISGLCLFLSFFTDIKGYYFSKSSAHRQLDVIALGM